MTIKIPPQAYQTLIDVEAALASIANKIDADSSRVGINKASEIAKEAMSKLQGLADIFEEEAAQETDAPLSPDEKQILSVLDTNGVASTSSVSKAIGV